LCLGQSATWHSRPQYRTARHLEQRLLAAGAEQREQACEFIVVAIHGGKDGNEDWLDDKNERADDERLREAVLMDVLQN